MLRLKLFWFMLILSLTEQKAIISSEVNDLISVSIIHINDYHARFEEIDELSSNTCKPELNQTCIGGYARTVTVIKQLLESQKDHHPIFLNAGDNFQGTLWYNILRGEVMAEFLNYQRADAMTLGNHEFDHKIEGLVPFLNLINSPILVSNMDASKEPSIQGLFESSTIINKDGVKIGVVGVILQTTNVIAQTEDLIFLNESITVKAEAAKLKQQGCKIIIVLSHCGLDVDQIIAAKAGPDIDVVIGGHTHTFMYSGPNYPGPYPPLADYPVVITQPNGHRVLVVQASSYTKFVGNLTVWFDQNGEIQSWEGAPVYLDRSIIPDPFILAKMEPYKERVDIESKKVIGTSFVTLEKGDCNKGDCNIGNLITDSYVHYYVHEAENSSYWTAGSIGISNAGGIRVSLGKGVITFGDLKTVIPFDNTIDLLEVKGKHIKEAIEYSLSDPRYMIQVSGLKIVANITKPVGKKVISVDALCRMCAIPQYYPLKDNEYYRVILTSFVANGGDGFTSIGDNKINHKVGPLDIDVVEQYVRIISPVMKPLDGRYVLLK